MAKIRQRSLNTFRKDDLRRLTVGELSSILHHWKDVYRSTRSHDGQLIVVRLMIKIENVLNEKDKNWRYVREVKTQRSLQFHSLGNTNNIQW